jgi:hypothetical protein
VLPVVVGGLVAGDVLAAVVPRLGLLLTPAAVVGRLGLLPPVVGYLVHHGVLATVVARLGVLPAVVPGLIRAASPVLLGGAQGGERRRVVSARVVPAAVGVGVVLRVVAGMVVPAGMQRARREPALQLLQDRPGRTHAPRRGPGPAVAAGGEARQNFTDQGKHDEPPSSDTQRCVASVIWAISAAVPLARQARPAA